MPPAETGDPPVEEVKKPRRPREEYPEFEDPAKELAAAEAKAKGMTKPNRDHLDAKTQAIQTTIEADKKKTDRITQDLEAIKEANAKKKESGSGELESVRTELRGIKAQIIGHIEEKKKMSSMIEAARAAKKAADEKLKAAKSSVGNFRSNDDIDTECERIEAYMQHNSLTLKEEKAMMLQIKELRASKESVANLEKMVSDHEKNTAVVGYSQIGEIIEMRKAKDVLIDALKEQETVAVEKLDALKAKREKEQSENRFSELFEQRSKIRDGITEKIQQIRAMRDEFKQSEDDFYKTDRLIRECKRQISKKNAEERERKKKEWEEAKAKRSEDWEAQEEAWKKEQEEAELVEDEDGKKVKPMDYDLSVRITLCEQLATFLKAYKPKEEVKAEVKKVETVDLGRELDAASGSLFVRDAKLEDDLGLNAFMVDEAVSAKKSKKDKKKAKAKAKASIIPVGDEIVSIELSLETIQQFGQLHLPVPVDTNDVDASLSQLDEKKAYYEGKAKEGLTLKEIEKAEKLARKQARMTQGEKDAEAAAAKKAEEDAAEAAEAEAMAKIKEQEEAAFAAKKAQEAEAKAAKAAAEAAAEAEAEKAAAYAEKEAKVKAAVEKAKEAKRLAQEKEEAEAAAAADPLGAFGGEADPMDDKFEKFCAENGYEDEDEEEEKEPEKEPEFDLAAMRAKAQNTSLTEEEKKARGLLYDTSIASAVREDSSEDEDDEDADFCGGDPFAEL